MVWLSVSPLTRNSLIRIMSGLLFSLVSRMLQVWIEFDLLDLGQNGLTCLSANRAYHDLDSTHNNTKLHTQVVRGTSGTSPAPNTPSQGLARACACPLHLQVHRVCRGRQGGGCYRQTRRPLRTSHVSTNCQPAPTSNTT